MTFSRLGKKKVKCTKNVTILLGCMKRKIANRWDETRVRIHGATSVCSLCHPIRYCSLFLCNHEPTRPSVSACMLELQCSQFFKRLKHAAHKETGQESFNWLLLPIYGLSVRAVAANLTSKL